MAFAWEANWSRMVHLQDGSLMWLVSSLLEPEPGPLDFQASIILCVGTATELLGFNKAG